MPGTLLRYLVQVGQDVDAGSPVAVVEAMKMENTITSAIKGKVKSLDATVGGKVSKGDILAVIA